MSKYHHQKQNQSWLSEFKFNENSRPLEQIIDRMKSIEKNNLFSNKLILILSTKGFEAQYVSENVLKILGYTPEEFCSFKDVMCEVGCIDQSDYYKKLAQSMRDFTKNNPHQNSESNAKGFFCGNRWRKKDGSIIRFLMRLDIIYDKNLLAPPYTVMFLEDVTHLLKDEKGYWFYFNSIQNEDVYALYSAKGLVETNPITNREAEVLRLIARGKSSKEVATELNISIATVSQHRKNMVRKIMAKDTSSLIQLCKTCEII